LAWLRAHSSPLEKPKSMEIARDYGEVSSVFRHVEGRLRREEREVKKNLRQETALKPGERK
jgi:hypothetical protein